MTNSLWVTLRYGLIRTGLATCGFALLASCAHRLPKAPIAELSTLAECSGTPAPTVTLNVTSLPIAMPPDLAAKGPNATQGSLARRITVMFSPQSAHEIGAIAWGRVTMRIYGGTFDGWTRVQSQDVLVEVARPAGPPSSQQQGADRESTMIDAAPGVLVLTRSATSRKPLSNAITVDALVVPGGIPVDEPLVRIPELWNSEGKPLAANDVGIQLQPTRHVPGYDLIESEVTLDYVSVKRNTNSACRGSARTRAVLVDKDGVRQPLWDLGFSSAANAPRVQWLALRDAHSGAFRAVFDSPTAATSFANWVRATQATSVGPYQIGVFDRVGRKPQRPLVPVDLSVTDQFRLITSKEAAGLRVGALGEP